MSRLRSPQAVAGGLVLALLAGVASAGSYRWNVGAGDWTANNAWLLYQYPSWVPTSTYPLVDDSVYISNGGTVQVPLGQTSQCKFLCIGTNYGSTQVREDLTLPYDTYVGSGFLNLLGTMRVPGDFRLGTVGSGTLTIGPGAALVPGAIHFYLYAGECGGHGRVVLAELGGHIDNPEKLLVGVGGTGIVEQAAGGVGSHETHLGGLNGWCRYDISGDESVLQSTVGIRISGLLSQAGGKVLASGDATYGIMLGAVSNYPYAAHGLHIQGGEWGHH